MSKIERGRYNDNVSLSLLFDIADGLQIEITMSVNEESYYKILANNIYKFRVLNNLSQKDLAEKLNVSAVYISQIENCRPNKGIASVVKIAQALNVPPCILFAEESCPKYLQSLEQAVSLSSRG